MNHLLAARRRGHVALSPIVVPDPDPDPPDPDPPGEGVLPPELSTFYWQLQGTVNTGRPEAVYDIDGFDNAKSVFTNLKGKGKYTIAYFSAGTWEPGRPDSDSFPSGVKGNVVQGWETERWLDVRAISTLQPIMEARVAVAKGKGAHAIEWDNLDVYDQSSGFSISQAQNKTWLQMLSTITRAAGLSPIFKNTPAFASWALPYFDACIVEEAYRYSEIADYMPWRNANKPVWAVEYTGTLNCTDANNRGIYLAKFPLDLNGAPTSVCSLTPPEEPSGSSIIGLASTSTSLTDYPKSANTTTGNYYVATNGNDSNNGTSVSTPFKTIGKALSVVSAGQTILVRAGTYVLSSRLTTSAAYASTVRLWGYGTERPVVDGSSLGSGSAGRMFYLLSASRRLHIKGFVFKGAKDTTFEIEGQNHVFEDLIIYDSMASGTHQFGGGNNTFLDVVVFKMGDGVSTDTNVADGMAWTHSSSSVWTTGNVAARCLVANAPDDGFDCFRARGTEFVDCVSVGAGYYWNGTSAGDGGGFKEGGNPTYSGSGGGNTFKGCIAIGCKTAGFNDNSSIVGNTLMFNTSVNSTRGFINGTDTCSDNISWNNPTYHAYNTGGSRNSWNLSNQNPQFESDFSLKSNSPYRNASAGGGPTGASDVALALLAKWYNHSKIWVPGRGAGPGGTGLPGDS